MSGHSKWSKVKHQKKTTDAVKGYAFTRASRAITIAVKEGGSSNPDHNFKLRLAIEKARQVNMSKETIERTVCRAAGEGAGAIEQVLYEAYGPGGAALLIEAATDNRQRTVSQVKNILERAGGVLASPGAVSFMFERCGILTISKASHAYDQILELASECGADDIVETDDVYEVYTHPAKLLRVKEAFEQKGTAIDNTELIMRPATTTEALDDEKRAMVESLTEHLEVLDDVQRVYTNIS